MGTQVKSFYEILDMASTSQIEKAIDNLDSKVNKFFKENVVGSAFPATSGEITSVSDTIIAMPHSMTIIRVISFKGNTI